jgi:hypothetical protein
MLEDSFRMPRGEKNASFGEKYLMVMDANDRRIGMTYEPV